MLDDNKFVYTTRFKAEKDLTGKLFSRKLVQETTSKLPTQRVPRISLSRCYALPIDRPAIWHSFIPSTIVLICDRSCDRLA